MAYPYGESLPNQGTDKWDLSEFYGRDSGDLLARMIFSEARGEGWRGKVAVGYVAKNRKAANKSYFGGNTYEGVLLKKYQFEGMTTKAAREPIETAEDENTPSEWQDSLYIALHLDSQTNPIDNRLYFGLSAPSGAKDVLKIGNHYFYNM